MCEPDWCVLEQWSYVRHTQEWTQRVQVDILKGNSSEKFLFQSDIILKSFIPKGHYSKDFYSEGSLYRNSE